MNINILSKKKKTYSNGLGSLGKHKIKIYRNRSAGGSRKKINFDLNLKIIKAIEEKRF